MRRIRAGAFGPHRNSTLPYIKEKAVTFKQLFNRTLRGKRKAENEKRRKIRDAMNEALHGWSSLNDEVERREADFRKRTPTGVELRNLEELKQRRNDAVKLYAERKAQWELQKDARR